MADGCAAGMPGAGAWFREEAETISGLKITGWM